MELTRRTMLAGGAVLGAGVVTAALGMGGRLRAPAGKIPVAFLMDDAATMIDFAGPWEVFQDSFDDQRFSLYTVAASRQPLQTTGNVSGGAAMRMTGLKFIADYTFADAPPPKVVVIGAQGGGEMPEKLAWIRAVAPGADVVMSVCTGAFLLANTGLLDGLTATTHHGAYDAFESKYPKVKLIRGLRYVDNGKFITAGGLTSGVDAALHVVDRYFGAAMTQHVAEYMEYQSGGWKA